MARIVTRGGIVRTLRLRPPKPQRAKIGRGYPWKPVFSSWIAKLRFVPTARVGNRALATGEVHMKTHRGGHRPGYGYGPGISQRSFNTWLVAASKGKYWWRYFTKRWSPARKL